MALVTPPPTSKPKDENSWKPLPWTAVFETSREIQRERDHFRVYEIETENAPVGEIQDPVAKKVALSQNLGPQKPLLVLIHGGGHSALSWCVFCEEITKLCQCRILAIDLAGHGHTKTEDTSDYSLERLSNDVFEIILEAIKTYPSSMGFDSNIVLIGHSLGGGIAVQVARNPAMKHKVKGLVVIDLVEGTAMESLSLMRGFLSSRPSSFPSLERAIEWSVRSGQVKNKRSARFSMPGQIIPLNDKDPATAFTWRVDLLKTESFWEGWFSNLSSKFLEVKSAKLLLLAGVDRLDKDMMVAQMQGQFQMAVLSNCGHMVHEDNPGQVATTIAEFLVRNRLSKGLASYKKGPPGAWSSK
eukprot:Sdes_comp9045_c0_seq1m478